MSNEGVPSLRLPEASVPSAVARTGRGRHQRPRALPMACLQKAGRSAHLCGGPSPCTARGRGLAEGEEGQGRSAHRMPPQPSLPRQKAVQGEQGDPWAGRRAAPIHVKRGFLDPGQRKGSLFPASQPHSPFTVQGSPVHVQEPLPGAMTIPAPSPRPAAAADPPQRS